VAPVDATLAKAIRRNYRYSYKDRETDTQMQVALCESHPRG
jgi:hypothetical protein